MVEVGTQPVHHSLEGGPAWGAIDGDPPDVRDVVIPSGAGRAGEPATVHVHDGHGVLPSHEDRWTPRRTALLHVWKRVVSARSLSLCSQGTRAKAYVSSCVTVRHRAAASRDARRSGSSGWTCCPSAHAIRDGRA